MKVSRNKNFQEISLKKNQYDHLFKIYLVFIKKMFFFQESFSKQALLM